MAHQHGVEVEGQRWRQLGGDHRVAVGALLEEGDGIAHQGRDLGGPALRARHPGKGQHALQKGVTVLTRPLDLAQQLAHPHRVVGLALCQLRHVDHTHQGIVDLVGDLADGAPHLGQLLDLDDALVLGAEAGEAGLQLALAAVVPLHPVQDQIKR